MSARIERIYKNLETIHGEPNPAFEPKKPAFWIEYYNEKDDQFSTDELIATEFPTHGQADEVAITLRENGKHGYVFATSIRETPPPPASLTHRRPYKRRETAEEHQPEVTHRLFGYDD